MEAEQLSLLANQLVEIKVPFADAEYKKELASELRVKIEETISLELLSNLTSEQADEYRQILEKQSSNEEDILAFINKNNIDINALTSAALTKFRIAYLGA